MTDRVPPPSPPGAHEPSGVDGAGPRRGRSKPPLGQRLQGLPRREQRSPRLVLLAVALHVAAVALLVQVIPMGYTFRRLLPFGNEDMPQERLTYVEPREQPAPAVPPVAVSPRTETRQPPQLTPNPQPIGVPDAPVTAAPAPAVSRDTGSAAPGNGVGALDPNVRGVRPGYTDERVWRGPVGGGGGGAVQGDRADNIGEMMRGVLMAAQDSVDSLARARGQTGRQPGDWTKTDGNGNRWGWDQQGIRLGKVTIPNALLGLLPLNAATAARFSANPTAMSNAARLQQSREDIQRMSSRGLGEAEFRRVVKEMDARRDSERRDRLRAPSASVAAPVRTADKQEPPR